MRERRIAILVSLLLLFLLPSAIRAADEEREIMGAAYLQEGYQELSKLDWQERPEAQKLLIEDCIKHLKKYKTGSTLPQVVRVLGWTMNRHSGQFRSTVRQEYQERTKREIPEKRLAGEVDKYYKLLFKYLDEAEKRELEDADHRQLRLIRATAFRITLSYGKAVQVYRDLIDSKPEREANEMTYLNLIYALMDQARGEQEEFLDFSAAIEECDVFARLYPRSKYWGRVVSYRATCFKEMGDVARAAKTLKDEEEYLRKAHAGEKVKRGGEEFTFSEKERLVFASTVRRLNHDLGIYAYALGRTEEAKKRWTQSVEELEPNDGEEKTYTPSTYLLRSAQKMLEFLRRMHGREAPRLDEVEWLTGRPPAAKERLVAIVFTNSGQSLAVPKQLERIRKENRRDFLPMLIASSRWNSSLQKDLKELRKKAKIGYPLGIDSTTRGKVGDRYRVDYGAGVFLLDRSGHMVWGHYSLSTSDLPMLRAVIERLLQTDSG